MTEQGMSHGEWIRWLGEAISTECEKPFEEIDYAFVEECGRLLDELLESTAAIPTEELQERLAKVNPVAGSGSEKKASGRHRRLWTVTIAAAVVLCMSITVLAVPAWRAALLTALRLDVGDSVEDNGIMYIHSGEVKHFANMDELISEEKLNILSFEDTQGVLQIEMVTYMDEANTTAITFNNDKVYFEIIYNINYVDDSIKNASTKYPNDLFETYILQKEYLESIIYYAYFYYDGNTYIIKGPSEEVLIDILNSLKKGD